MGGARDLPDPTLVLDGQRARRRTQRAGGNPSPADADNGGQVAPSTGDGPEASGLQSDSEQNPNDVIDIDDSDAETVNDASTGQKRRKSVNSDGPSRKRPRSDPPPVTAPDVPAGTEEGDNAASTSRTKSSGDPTAVDKDGFLADVEVTSLNGNQKKKTDAIKDIKHFFDDIYHMSKPGGKVQSRRICKACHGGKKSIVAEATTLRRHLEAEHYAAYHRWAKKNDFESALPSDRRAKKEAEAKDTQPTLDQHLREKPEQEVIIPYSDALFREAAIEWLVATDQPIDALENPKFVNMIDIAARAKNGVRLPKKKATRKGIINLFQERMDNLRKKLNGPTVSGEIHITDDAWQADNGDGYLAVTGHWIEEVSPGIWESREALIGFTRLNNAHNGVRLGQALYKIVARLGIQKRIGYMTTDGAANNGTAAIEFAKQLLERDQVVWDPVERHLPCMAHIINLATQALIAAYSKAPHFDPKNPENHVPDTDALFRDEIGLVRAIAVKSIQSHECQERSSAKRREIFKGLQVQASARTDGVEFVDLFVHDIAFDGSSLEERAKIRNLKLTAEEWTRHAEKAQQAFSSGTIPSLHNAIPALEALHSAWSKRAKKPDNIFYADALEKAADKINEYYEKSAKSTAQVMAMGRYFDKHWGAELAKEARDTAETILARPQPSSKFGTLLRELTPESDDDEPTTSEPHRDPQRPWLDEFEEYYTSRPEVIPENISMVAWWGMCRSPSNMALAGARPACHSGVFGVQ
ncbi:putative AC transposase [Favolaschia claudopus]|uniref:AC transposase n=1 Tax=Favolaschia claudopus TaxID=2862362 RepID=A0AAV9Z3Z6_9AGAR